MEIPELLILALPCHKKNRPIKRKKANQSANPKGPEHVGTSTRLHETVPNEENTNFQALFLHVTYVVVLISMQAMQTPIFYLYPCMFLLV